MKLCSLALTFAFVPVLAQAAPQVIWSIGKFDSSPVEFASKMKDAAKFQVGKSDPKNDWPRNQRLGEPNQIQFRLDAVDGAYALKIAALIEQPRVPVIEVGINGQKGKFYLHPKLSYSRSDFSYAFDPHESESTIVADLPASALKAGENVVTIGLANDPATPDDQRVTGISFDAVSFEHDPAAKPNGSVAAALEPTIFYRQGEGGLVEVVDAFLHSSRPIDAGEATLMTRGKTYRADVKGTTEFGEERVSFDVAEWQGLQTVRFAFKKQLKKPLDVSLTAQRKWTVFVVPHTHLDVGFTDYQGKVAETQPRVLGQAADLIEQYPDFRFSMDGSWNLEQLLNTRSQAEQDRVLNLIRNGKMAMPAQNVNLLTGYASLETLYRSLYASSALAKQHGLPFEYANITDVPTYSASYPSVLANSGVKYWVAAANNDRAPVFHFDHWNEKSPYWWQGPDGKKVLFWYSRHYMMVQTLFGLPPVQQAIRESLPIFMQAYAKPSYKPDVALLYGAQVENTDLFPSIAKFATEWNKTYAYPKLNYATFPDFFHYVDEHYGRDLATYKGDGGGYWEDGIGSDAYFAARDRENQNRVLSAEVLSTLTHSLDPKLNPPKGVFDEIWRNIILFAEHTWLSWNAISQPDHEEAQKQLRVKDSRAERASLDIEDVTNRSLSQLADRIHVPANTLVVFNSLGWKRDAVVELDLFENPTLTDLTTKQVVPLQILYEKQKFHHVRFLAKDLPPVGYRCFGISYGDKAPAKAQQTTSEIVENNFYRVKIDQGSGALSSIFDKQLQREIVDASSPYKFGQNLYVTGGDGDTQVINPFPALPPAELTIHPAANGKLVGVEQMPWGHSIRTVSSNVNTPSIETEFLLFNTEKKIEFRVRMHKDYTTKKEAVYFAFPAAVKTPQFAYASQQGWIDPAKDLLKGGSLEWFNIQHWMAARDADMTVGVVPVDAPLASLGDINRGKWPSEFKPASGTIFSYAMNNYWTTNYRAGQGGDFTFRYVVTSSKQLDGVELGRLGLQSMRQAEVDYVVGQDKAGNPDRPLAAEGQGFLGELPANVTLSTWKRAADGNGTVMRLVETSGKATNAQLQFQNLKIASAWMCSGVEINQHPLPAEGSTVTVPLQPLESVTIRLAAQ